MDKSSPPHPAPLALFDFDHTITRADTFSGFAVWLILRSPGKLLLGALMSPLLGLMFAVRRSRKVALRLSVWLATAGLDEDTLLERIRNYVGRKAQRGERFVRSEALEAVSRLQADGHLVVIVTGSLQALAEAICDSEGVQGVTVVGSTLRRSLGGMIADRHCVGHRKLEMLAERGFVPPWEIVYTDHVADLPLLRDARAAFLVNPKRKSRDEINAALGSTVRILEWS
jgi:phosphatidylglycerophosphatase C